MPSEMTTMMLENRISSPALQVAYREGWAAYRNGESIDSSGYPKESNIRSAFMTGWLDSRMPDSKYEKPFTK